MKSVVFLFLLICLSNSSFSQTKISLGLDYSYNFTSNKLSGNSGTPYSIVGMKVEVKKSKWVGFETGLFYRMYADQLVLEFNPTYHWVDIKQKYISIPILYKVSTKFLNISIGTNIDYCYGIQTTMDNTISYPDDKTPMYYHLPNQYLVTTYNNPYQKFYFGLSGKLSRDIHINKQLDFEPQLRYSQNFSNNRNYYGLGFGCSVKYIL